MSLINSEKSRFLILCIANDGLRIFVNHLGHGDILFCKTQSLIENSYPDEYKNFSELSSTGTE